MVLKNAGQGVPEGKFYVGKLEQLFNYFRAHSLWPVNYGCGCCPIELMAVGTARYDLDRFGYAVFRNSPRQADVLLVIGPVTKKMKPIIERVYAQMPEPKWVIAVGNCATSGGPFKDSYNIVRGADTFLPVDVFVPGCPPRPEGILNGFLTLKKKLINPKIVQVSSNG